MAIIKIEKDKYYRDDKTGKVLSKVCRTCGVFKLLESFTLGGKRASVTSTSHTCLDCQK